MPRQEGGGSPGWRAGDGRDPGDPPQPPIDCFSATNSGLFIRHGGIRSDVPPTEVVCVRCIVRGGTSYAVRINESIRSGIRDSTICQAPFGAIKILDGAVDPVDEGNRIVRCD